MNANNITPENTDTECNNIRCRFHNIIWRSILHKSYKEYPHIINMRKPWFLNSYTLRQLVIQKSSIHYPWCESPSSVLLLAQMSSPVVPVISSTWRESLITFNQQNTPQILSFFMVETLFVVPPSYRSVFNQHRQSFSLYSFKSLYPKCIIFRTFFKQTNVDKQSCTSNLRNNYDISQLIQFIRAFIDT